MLLPGAPGLRAAVAAFDIYADTALVRNHKRSKREQTENVSLTPPGVDLDVSVRQPHRFAVLVHVQQRLLVRLLAAARGRVHLALLGRGGVGLALRLVDRAAALLARLRVVVVVSTWPSPQIQ